MDELIVYQSLWRPSVLTNGPLLGTLNFRNLHIKVANKLKNKFRKNLLGFVGYSRFLGYFF